MSNTPKFPGPLTARGAVLAVLLSDVDQTGAEPLLGRTSLNVIGKTAMRKCHKPSHSQKQLWIF